MHTLFISRPIVKDGERKVQFKQCLTLRGQITNKLFCVNLRAVARLQNKTRQDSSAEGASR